MKIESKIIATINELRGEGILVNQRSTKNGEAYDFGNSRYKVELHFEPPKWLGLEFTLMDPTPSLRYSIDTDLYDFRDPDNQEFVNEIMREIIEFISNLKNNKLRIMYKKNRPSMLIPCGDTYALIKKGRFISSRTSLSPLSEARIADKFRPFPFR